jgi:ABC-type proline/glycine betaine transport system permease subunit
MGSANMKRIAAPLILRIAQKCGSVAFKSAVPSPDIRAGVVALVGMGHIGSMIAAGGLAMIVLARPR